MRRDETRPDSGARRHRVPLYVWRTVLVLGVVAMPFAYLVYGALVSPDVEFLPPAGRGGWALYPGQPVRARKPVSMDVTFRRSFDLDEIPERLDLDLTAFTRMTAVLNGHLLDVPEPPSWKRGATIDLAPYALVGRNELAIRVSNPGSLPALLVEAPAGFATRGAWEARLEGTRRARFVPVAPPLARPANPGLLQRAAAWRWARWVAGAWLALVVCIGLAVAARQVLGRRGARDVPGAVRRAPRRWLGWAVPTAILSGAFALNLFNASVYPPNKRGFDFWGHLQHVLILAQQWRSPLASEGWQTYHPPLYYAFAAMVYSLAGPAAGIRAVQYAGATVGLGLPLLTWLAVRRLAPHDPGAQWVALAFAAFLPVTLYMNPQVNNEAFAATVIAAGIYCAVLLVERPVIPARYALLAGVVAGAGLLSKFSGLFAAGAAATALLLRAIDSGERRDRTAALAFGLGVVAVCGWFYVRNVVAYGHPFVGNWEYDPDGLRTFEQLPAYRTLAFYARFGSAFFDHPTESVFTSFLDGNYATLWADGQHAFFRDDGDAAFGWMGATMLVAALPTLAITLGFARTASSALRRPSRNGDVVLTATGCWTLAALVLYTMQIPIYSAVKASFFLFLVPTLGVCLARGRAMLEARLPASRVLLDAAVVVAALLTAWTYRFHE